MLIGVGACALAVLAWADANPASATWPGWHVETNEDYDAPGYPISWMFDNDPSTAWVFSYKPYHLAAC
jgi:hypothetical protein